ncbi:MAG TPA: hypothetical protein VK724_01795 [Bryobacteraceae bacterium]|jgi:hypothetical protein|nr:hypothetical protein [Bryobacteraceae bacterium]
MPRGSRYRFLLFLSIAVCLGEEAPATRVVEKNQGFLPFADAPINYRSSELNDPVAKLEKRLERGELKLHYDPKHGYLKSILDALHISVSSQALVFSKTSFQYPEINPGAPRALYYNDDVYVGQVHDGRFLEFASFDPMQGAIFYVMDEHRDKQPRFERSEVDCIQCHVAGSTKGIPGVMLRSVFTKPDGTADATEKSFITGQESPISQRWGGWYVTAKNGGQGAMSTNPAGQFNTASYLTGSSDIVALMVLAHQTQMHNWITLTNYTTRIVEADPKRSAEERQKQIEGSAEKLVRYLLFTNEIPLQAPIAGTSDFARQFAARGPRDSQGRSLRDFDLQKRIFKYPCSYLIYSEAFDAIPASAKDYIYRRLFDILSGREQGPEFASLSNQDRRAILEILVATKPGLPQNWKQEVRKGNS